MQTVNKVQPAQPVQMVSQVKTARMVSQVKMAWTEQLGHKVHKVKKERRIRI